MSIRARACQPFRLLPATALAVLAMAAGAEAPSPARPPVSRITGTVQGTPLSQRLHTVVLKMAGDPVAVVRSRMPNKQLAEADRRNIEKELSDQTDHLCAALTGM